MMLDAWIGHCILRSEDRSQRFWSVESDVVVLRLVVRATNVADFEGKVAASLSKTGVDLVGVETAEAASNRYLNRSPSWEMLSALSTVDDVTPLMVGDAVARPLRHDFHYAEISWSDLPPARDLWAIIDGVTWEGLPQQLKGMEGVQAVCLYTSTDPKSLAAAPWLVRLDTAEGIYQALSQRKPEHHSGFMFRSPLTLKGLRRHFRRFTMLATPIGGEVPQYFRFYDPRVMLDAIVALDASVRDQLLRPLRGLVIPLSPDCLLPIEAELKPVPSVFDDPASYADRLVKLSWNFKDLMPIKPSRMAIDQPSFDRFGQLKSRRALNDLAKQLFDEFANGQSPDACVRAADRAPSVATKFGLSSKKQVVAIGRALLTYGPDFWISHDEANRILTDSASLPWQRKNALNDWMDKLDMARSTRAAS